MRKSPAYTREEYARFLSEGVRPAELARRAGVSRDKVEREIDRHGLERRRYGTPGVPAASADKYREMYESGLGTREIAKSLGISRTKVRRDMESLGVQAHRKANRTTTVLPEQKLRQLYVRQRLSVDQVAAQLGATARKVTLDLKRHGIALRKGGGTRPLVGSAYPNIAVPVRRLAPVPEFFRSIESDVQAYALGFAWADGCIEADGRALRIAIAEEDLHLLQELQEHMGGTLSVRAPQVEGHQAKVQLWVNSWPLVRDLRRWGMTPRKDEVLPEAKPPPIEFCTAFVRGLVDGDGHVGLHRGYPRVRFTNRNASLRAIVKQEFGRLSGEPAREYSSRDKKYWHVCAPSKRAGIAVARGLYLQGEQIALVRKRAMACAICEAAKTSTRGRKGTRPNKTVAS